MQVSTQGAGREPEGPFSAESSLNVRSQAVLAGVAGERLPMIHRSAFLESVTIVRAAGTAPGASSTAFPRPGDRYLFR
jgi:hypothetical protein